PSSILTTTGFYACRIVGTLVGAWVLVRCSDVRYLRWNMAAALLLVVVLLFVRSAAAVYAAIGLLGFAMSCVFATFYAVATRAEAAHANGVAGLAIMAISAGALSGPVCGAIVRAAGDAHTGMLFVAACVGYMLWAACKLQIKNEE
ncbi:MAG: MFS transporter, partial [Alistipes sp.]|nr:MFS transporter [Alistipes sp.]